MAPFSTAVQRTFYMVVKELGEAFSFQELTSFIASHRGKLFLRFEQRQMPVALTGWCIALQDVDLIVVRSGMDEISTQAVKLHEIAHLLLGHVPRLSYGLETPTYKQFQHCYAAKNVVYRTHQAMYDTPHEYDAETLATLLLECIWRERSSLPDSARDVHG